jgi:hypothetical protein
LRGLILDLLYAFDDVLFQPFVPNGAVVALDISILLGLSRLAVLAVLDGDLVLLGPLSQRFADVFGAIVDPDRARFSPPFYDPVEAPYDPLGRKREIHLDPQSFAVEVPLGVCCASPAHCMAGH